MKYKGNEYIKRFFMKTDNIRHISHDLFQIMEKVISLSLMLFLLYLKMSKREIIVMVL